MNSSRKRATADSTEICRSHTRARALSVLPPAKAGGFMLSLAYAS